MSGGRARMRIGAATLLLADREPLVAVVRVRGTSWALP